MTDGTKVHPLELFIAAMLGQALEIKPEQMNTGTGTKPTVRVFSDSDSEIAKILEKVLNSSLFTKPTTPEPKIAGSNPTALIHDGIDPAIEAQLEAIFSTRRGEQTYGEKLVGFDPNIQYPHVISETLQDFADIIDVLVSNCASMPGTNARLAIEAIQVANFWVQKALSQSKL